MKTFYRLSLLFKAGLYGEISEQFLKVWLFWFLDFLTPSCFCSQEASRYAEPKKLPFTFPLSDPDLHLAVYVSLQVEYLMGNDKGTLSSNLSFEAFFILSLCKYFHV